MATYFYYKIFLVEYKFITVFSYKITLKKINSYNLYLSCYFPKKNKYQFEIGSIIISSSIFEDCLTGSMLSLLLSLLFISDLVLIAEKVELTFLLFIDKTAS